MRNPDLKLQVSWVSLRPEFSETVQSILPLLMMDSLFETFGMGMIT
jgi:hypothetical protein